MKKTENEKKKEFLMGYQVAKKDVARLEQQLEELRMNKLSPSCMIGDGMPHAHELADLSDYAAKVDELEREIWAARYCRIRAFQIIQSAIESMNIGKEKDLLTYRYLRGMKWEKICVEMKHSWQHIHRIHASALKNLKSCDGM